MEGYLNHLQTAREVFDIEIEQLLFLRDTLGESFNRAIDCINSCDRIIIAGIGKSGIIGKKIAATMSSTGTPAMFMNAGEAMHGDLGMVTKNDAVMIISNSGETKETVDIIMPLKKIGAKIIALTGVTASTLANAADAVLYCGVEREACPLQLAPTSSTTATLLMGDALAVAMMKAKNFKKIDFAKFHPGGSLGKMLLNVADVMKKGKDIPFVSPECGAIVVLNQLTEKKMGGVCVLDAGQCLMGFITDGDIRRAIQSKDKFFDLKAKDIMNTNPITLNPTDRIIDIMEKEINVTVAPVVENDKVVGIIRML